MAVLPRPMVDGADNYNLAGISLPAAYVLTSGVAAPGNLDQEEVGHYYAIDVPASKTVSLNLAATGSGTYTEVDL